MLSRHGVAVLMYHGVGEPAPRGEAHYTVDRRQLEQHLDLLAASGRVVPFSAMVGGGAPPDSVVITFDDGERSVADVALPMMQERGLSGALFVTTAWIGERGYVGVEHIRAFADAGWTIGAHGVTHRYLCDLDSTDVRMELTGSREALARVLGAPPEHMSLPGGREKKEVVDAVRRAGFWSLCTSRAGLNPSPPERFAIRRLMVLRSWDVEMLRRVLDGDMSLLVRQRLRQEGLGLAKRALGNQRYDRWRGVAFGALDRIRSRK
jgi:peptidoglycan/xylan/chitin deacetylase (PgdA/CDA1 family)